MNFYYSITTVGLFITMAILTLYLHQIHAVSIDNNTDTNSTKLIDPLSSFLDCLDRFDTKYNRHPNNVEQLYIIGKCYQSNKLPENEYRMSDEGMSPFLHTGDFFLINSSVSFSQLSKGDVIVFKTPGDSSDIRVFRITLIGFDKITNEQIVVTKGDNATQSYMGLDFPIKYQNYIGKVVSVVKPP